MQLDADQADRLAFPGAVHGRVAQFAGINQRDTTAADHFQIVARTDESSGVLVEPDTNRERVVGQRSQKAPEAVSLAKMLVDDKAVGQAETGRERDFVGRWRRALAPSGDHVLW